MLNVETLTGERGAGLPPEGALRPLAGVLDGLERGHGVPLGRELAARGDGRRKGARERHRGRRRRTRRARTQADKVERMYR